MNDLRSLYQEMILDHYKAPRNFETLPDPVRKAKGNNPLCGDQIEVFVDLEGDTVRRVGFQGHGCAISTASASLMTEIAEGMARSELEQLGARFRDVVTGKNEAEDAGDLGKLEALLGVRDYPVRVKCATLAWHALVAALDSEPTAAQVPSVSTEN